MSEMTHPTPEHSASEHFEYLVVGAGPAGVQMGFHLQQAGRSYQILEAGSRAGTFFETHPRHRTLISINKVYTGYDDREINERWDWNSILGDGTEKLFKEYSKEYFPPADALLDYLNDYVEHFGLAVRYDTEVTRIEKPGDRFELTVRQGGTLTCDHLIVATGFMRPNLPPIPGIELTENYVDVSVDPEDFIGQRVLILGKGNSGFETADNLVGTTALIHIASPTPIRLAWQTHHVGHLRAVNNNFLDTYQLKSQNAVLDCHIESIEKAEDGTYRVAVSYTHADEEAEVAVYDRVIVCAGFAFDDGIFGDSCRPEVAIDGRFPKLGSDWQSVNVPGLYFAGTLMHMRDFKKFTSGFIHGFRYNVRALHHLLEERNHGRAWPSRSIPDTPEGLTEAMIDRINRTPALWQQFGFLCDLVVPQGDGTALYYEDLPFDLVRDQTRGGSGEYFLMDLEFGKKQADPFHVARHPDPERGEDSFFLHPVIRHYEGTEMLGEHHILEDLYAEWHNEKAHVAPLRRFLAQRQAAAVAGG